MNLEQQRAHYKAVRARIAGKPVTPVTYLLPTASPDPMRLPRLPVSDRTRFSIQQILSAYSVEWPAIVGHCRKSKLTAPRRAICWLLHCNGFSSVAIARIMNRDHSSIINALQKANSWTRKQSCKKPPR